MSYMDATRYKSVPVIPKRCLLWDLTQPGSNSKNAGEINQMCVWLIIYQGRSINKLQNGVILLFWK